MSTQVRRRGPGHCGSRSQYVKPVESGSDSDGSAKKDKLREGDKVKARYPRPEKYLQGRHPPGALGWDLLD